MSVRRSVTRVLAAAAALLAIPACSDTKPHAPAVALNWGQKVSGKVTYKGEPVPYGFVLLYNPAASVRPGEKPGEGAILPLATAKIEKDGAFEFGNAPEGPAIFCLATDPDVTTGELLLPSSMGGGHVGARLGGPPGPPGRPPGPRGSRPGVPEGAPVIPRSEGNPALKDLSADQKQTLREIQKKYGSFERPLLFRVIRVGEQTINLELD
jgi:hypothetical protein